MKTETSKLFYTKRARPVIRDSVLMTEAENVHLLVEKTAKAISDWHSESDWPVHTDRAIRAIEAVAEHLGREGHKEAKIYLQSILWREPKPRVNQDENRTARLFF